MSEQTHPREHGAMSGILLLTVGLFLFSIQDVIIKTFSDRYAVMQIVLIRSIVAVSLLLGLLLVLGKPQKLRLHSPWPIFIKGGCGFLSYTTYYLAMAALPIAEVATITFSAPIMVTAISAFLLKEQVGFRRWSAVLVGFVAVVLVVGPKGHFNNPAVVLALMAAFTYAISTITTRFIDPRDEAITAAFYSLLTFLVMGIIAVVCIELFAPPPASANVSLQFLLRDWVWPTTLDFSLLILLGGIAICGFYCLTRAYMVAEFSAVAPFEYTYIVWGVLFGYLCWRELPTAATALGIGLLVTSNLYIIHRERVKNRRSAVRRPRTPRR